MLYELMVLFDIAETRKDYDGLVKLVDGLIKKAGGDIKATDKYGERKLAYSIAGATRGAYVVWHFEAPGETIAKLERSLRLSDKVLRHMVVRDADGIELAVTISDEIAIPDEDNKRFVPRKDREDRAPRNEGAPSAEGGAEKAAEKPAEEASETTEEPVSASE